MLGFKAWLRFSDTFGGAQVGWKHEKAVAELEDKRKVESAKYFETKKKLAAVRARAEATVPAA